MNIALYCCHFKVMPVCSPRKMTTQPQFNKNEFHTSQASEGSIQYIKILSLICNPRKHTAMDCLRLNPYSKGKGEKGLDIYLRQVS